MLRNVDPKMLRSYTNLLLAFSAFLTAVALFVGVSWFRVLAELFVVGSVVLTVGAQQRVSVKDREMGRMMEQAFVLNSLTGLQEGEFKDWSKLYWIHAVTGVPVPPDDR